MPVVRQIFALIMANPSQHEFGWLRQQECVGEKQILSIF